MSINITFMLGNGFDIQQGLNTRYTDFYNSKIKQVGDNKVNNIFYKEAYKDIEKWSDFEWQLGEFTKNDYVYLSDEEQELFFDDLDDVINDLVDYLQEEEGQFAFDEEVINKTMLNTLNTFHKELAPIEYEAMNSRLRNESSVVFNFISFNYTDTISKFVSTVTDKRHRFFGQGYDSAINQPVYVHGSHDYHVVLGVDNANQLNSDMFSEREMNELMKFSIIKEARDGRLEKSLNIVSNSSVIVIFGMALGETDKSWWQAVGEWLKKSTNNWLVIHSYQENYSQRLTRKVSRIRRSVEESFLSHLDLDEGEDDKLRKQIFVIINSKNTFMLEN